MLLKVSDSEDAMKLWSSENTICPSTLGICSNTKRWWGCSLGHEWEASPEKIHRGQRCPYCSNKKVLRGYNDLFTIVPELKKLWSPNNTLNPETLTYGSKKEALWRCNLGHEWIKPVYVVSKGERCPYCSNHRLLKGFNDFASKFSFLLEIWDYSKNVKSPDSVLYGSSEKIWWICSLNHSWKTSLSKITWERTGCPYCSVPVKKLLKGFNDLRTLNKSAEKFWNFSRNKIRMDEVTVSSDKKVWWICELGHEWKKSVAKFSGGERCPYCAGKRVLLGFNDLRTKCPKLEERWINSAPIESFHQNSEKIVKIACLFNGKIFNTTVRRVSSSYPFCCCEDCTKSRSALEKSVAEFVSQAGFETIFNNRKIIAPVELDIVIPSLKIAIEVNGNYWHSEEVIQNNKGISAREHHQNKVDKCLEKGYSLFFVWESDWKDHHNEVKQELSKVLSTPNYRSGLLLKLEMV